MPIPQHDPLRKCEISMIPIRFSLKFIDLPSPLRYNPNKQSGGGEKTLALR